MSPALPAGLIVAVILAGVGLVFSRPDLVLIGIPLLLATAWAWDKRPRSASTVTLSLELAGHSVSGQGLDYTLNFTLPGEAGAVQLRVTTMGEITHEIAITPDAAKRLRGRLAVIHSGPQELLRVDYRLVTVGEGFTSAPVRGITATRVITPATGALSALPLPPRLAGLTGSHDSTRPGDGGDFHDIHLFSPGDRLRRIDWKATARRANAPGELYVRRSSATADATVLLVIDSRDDVADNVESWGGNAPASNAATSMDLARNAAGSLAAAYIASGDRVGFQDLASQSRTVRPGGGARHLARLLQMIAQSRPFGAPERRRRAPAITSGALVVVFSTFLDDEAGRMAAQWRAIGHRVIAVDVLPTPRAGSLSREETVAYRIVTMERGDRIRDLADAGVEVIRWQAAGNGLGAAAQLRAISRRRSTAR